MTMYQIEKQSGQEWEKVGNPFVSSLAASLATMQWLKDETTRIEPVDVEFQEAR